ncbi:hypothetical protein [Enterovibrio paralichthyis]|uniref:hypothetical protein n=1 Tax=Enterovibrio paralichthyis TaxID=2853805 RepID=UPI001C476499|nr:hypothetical protein [Enterovibrio paralichthyis]MBV7298046.1 hypothetical protein [Enterovibrio paralichthyis]
MTESFFSPTSIASVATATAMVVAVSTALHNFIGLKPKITAFIFSQAIAVLNVIVAKDAGWLDWALFFFNGCLLYCTALGLNQSLSPTGGGGAVLPRPRAKAGRLFRSWLQ